MSHSLKAVEEMDWSPVGFVAPFESRARSRLLLVDDDVRLGRGMADIARECGYDVEVAISARGFCAAYELRIPDVVLLDLSLPGGDGVELMRFLAHRQSRALVLIVSGFNKRVVEAACRLGDELGLVMGACLTKPIPACALKQAIERSAQHSVSPGGGENAKRACLT